MTKGIAAMIHQILWKAKDNGLNMQVVLKQVMAKLLSKRIMCK